MIDGRVDARAAGTTLGVMTRTAKGREDEDGMPGAMTPPRTATLVALALAAGALCACTPTVAVQAPKEPITINLNVKLDADVRLRVEEKAEDDVENNPIF